MAAAGYVQVGPWGGNGGHNDWNFKLDNGSMITKITVNSNSECIYSITFTFKDRYNVSHTETYGVDGGHPQTASLIYGEQIKGISGTFNPVSGHLVITSLSFKGSENDYGPYGNQVGTSFSLPVISGKFVEFFGKHGDYLDSLGVVLSP